MTEDEVRAIIADYLDENLDTLIAEYLESKGYMTETQINGAIEQVVDKATTPSQDVINEMVYEYNQTDDGINQIQNICGDYITENFDLE